MTTNVVPITVELSVIRRVYIRVVLPVGGVGSPGTTVVVLNVSTSVSDEVGTSGLTKSCV